MLNVEDSGAHHSSNEWAHRHLENYPTMVISPLLLIILLVLVFGSLPAWPHSRHWGYYPSGGLGLVRLILLLVFLLR